MLTLTVIFALRNFDLIWVTTGGGPGDATTTPSVLLYELGFEARRLGTRVGDRGAADGAHPARDRRHRAPRRARRARRRPDEQQPSSASLTHAAAHRVQRHRGLPARLDRAARAERPERPRDRVQRSRPIPTLDNFVQAWTRAASPRALLNSTIVTLDRGRGLGRPVGAGGLRAWARCASPGRRILFFVLMTGPDHPLRVAHHPALPAVPGLGPHGQPAGADPAPDRASRCASARSGCARSSGSAPRSLIEAARVDGAGHFRTLVGVLVPERACRPS